MIRDRYSRPIEYRQLRPRTDLCGALEKERAQRTAGDWSVEAVPSNCAFCLAARGRERVCISMKCYERERRG